MATRRAFLQGAAGGAAALAIGGIGLEQALAQAASRFPQISYNASEYVFQGPTTFAGGLTQVTLVNKGTMDHHGMFLLINKGKTAADVAAAAKAQGLAGIFSVATSVGGPGTIGPGETSSVIIDFKAGNYLLVCVIPDPDGQTHMSKGMALPVTVSAPPAKAVAAPGSSHAVTLADFTFEHMPSSTSAGKHIWKVKNGGKQLHELALFKLAPGVSLEALVSAVSASPAATPAAGAATPAPEMATPQPAGATPAAATPAAAAGVPPAVSAGGFAPVSPGNGGWMLLDVVKGSYAALCFVPDAKTGKPHYDLGMAALFKVV